MTCREMEPLLRDMALEPEGKIEGRIEPAMPSGAAAHLDGCPRCSAQFERERRLTASLAGLAGSVETCGASAPMPAAMEDRLRAAFREHWREHRNDRRPAFQLPARRPSLWAAGAAAIIVVSLGVMLLEWNPPVASRESSAAPARLTPSASPAPTTGIEEPLPGAFAPNPSASQAVNPVAARTRVPPSREAGEAMSAGEQPTMPSPEGDLTASRRTVQRVSSEFVPLFYGGDPLLLGAGQVWRVEMPRGALQSVGMPVVEESRAGRIQVDILLGEDGIARAIRLVQ